MIGIVSESDLVVDRFGHDPRNQVRADVVDRIADYRGPAGGWDVQVTDGAVVIVGDLHDDGRAAAALARTVPGVDSVHLATHRTPTPS